MDPLIRPFRPGDEPGIVETVRGCFTEYGFTWETDGYCADLYDPQKAYHAPGGAFWVADSDGRIVACVGFLPHDLLPGRFGETVEARGKVRAAGTDCSLERLYVRAEARNLGLGTRLTIIVLDEAKRRDCCAVELWSDKMLLDAHRLYVRLGASRVGERVCDDPDQSAEWGFAIKVG